MKIYCLLLLIAALYSCGEWKNDIYIIDDAQSENTSDSSSVSHETESGQLYNMSFDDWSKEGSAYVCYAADASQENRTVWGTPNKTTAGLGKPTYMPETGFVAVKGPGKSAAMIQSRLINMVLTKKLAAGTLFTGQMGDINLSTMNASLKWGIPFSGRPKSLEGYACYRPVKIDVTKSPYESKKGETDTGHIFVVLADWDGQFIVDSGKGKFLDTDNDPGIIGYGRVAFDHYMNDYEKFVIDIEYRNDRTPKYVVIVAASSVLGDYFTGGDGSALYLDEFRFNY